MMLRKILFLGCLFFIPALHAQLILKAGLKITSSIKIKTGTYRLNTNAELATSVIEIEGNNLVIDFNNAILDGNMNNTGPDKFFGLAINIKTGKNITIKNLTARGYKVALIAREVQGLTIEHCNFSYNYRQHLYSTQQKEDLSDWMSYHHNEKDEWLRYGAAMYLRGCKRAIIHDNTVNDGQCALMLTQCDSSIVYNNDFSYNSGIGVGMYRSSENSIIHNRLDFNVRGHSEGVYNRGQDAAAILVFEQCNNNVFAYNSATHSGDGFFLWAGQTTMDSGEGGCNGNRIYNNDFSFAPTNGVEATFSTNTILFNTIRGCDNGVWAGYSYNTVISKNDFSDNNVGIAIEHGQNICIQTNNFRNEKEGLKIWARAIQPSGWGYVQKRNVESKNYEVCWNGFDNVRKPMSFSQTDSLIITNNYTSLEKFEKASMFLDSNVHKLDTLYDSWPCPDVFYDDDIINKLFPKKIKTPVNKKLEGRYQIRMTAWGPYDFKYPLLWNTNPISLSDTMQFEIIGPKGKWKLVNQRGVKNISSLAGVLPAAITAIKTNEKNEDVFIELEYEGSENITTAFGEKIIKGRKYRFNYRNNLVPLNWKVNWYGFDSSLNPIQQPTLLTTIVAQTPLLSEETKDLHYAWWNGIGKEKKQERFLTIAEADTDLPSGEYLLGASWEDVLRVYVDGRVVLDEWKPLEHLYDESPHREIPVNLAGRHHIKIEQANLAGFATLIIQLKKK